MSREKAGSANVDDGAGVLGEAARRESFAERVDRARNAERAHQPLDHVALGVAHTAVEIYEEQCGAEKRSAKPGAAKNAVRHDRIEGQVVEALGEIRGASLREELVNDLALAWVDAVARGDAVKARGEDFDLGAGERIDGFGVGHGSAENKNAARRAQGRLRAIAKGPRERGRRQPASSTL